MQWQDIDECQRISSELIDRLLKGFPPHIAPNQIHAVRVTYLHR